MKNLKTSPESVIMNSIGRFPCSTLDTLHRILSHSRGPGTTNPLYIANMGPRPALWNMLVFTMLLS